MVIEKVPAGLATEVADMLEVPIVGIGAGGGCDGQILVSHDMLGLYTKFNPRFVRRYAGIAETMLGAFGKFLEDVKARDFPSEDESY